MPPLTPEHRHDRKPANWKQESVRMWRTWNPSPPLTSTSNGAGCWKAGWRLPKKITDTIPVWPSNSTSGFGRWRTESGIQAGVCTPMFKAMLFATARRWKHPASTGRRTGKQNAVYIHVGVLLSLEKEGNSDSCFSIDGPWGPHAEWNKSDVKGQMLSDSTCIGELE